MKFLLYDFRWVDPETVEFQASLYNKFGRKKVQIGDNISLELVRDVRCAGSFFDAQWHPCPEQNTGKSKCELCRARERKESFVYTIFDGYNTENITPEDLQRIAGPHWVYLALFDVDLIKVGVSRADRKMLRQVEQGAYATLYISKTPDGTSARQIETTLRKSGIQDKVLGSQKIHTYDPGLSIDEADMALRSQLENAQKAVQKQKGLVKFLLEEPEFVLWEDVYHLKALRSSSKKIHPVKLQKGEWVSGTVLAKKGSFLFLETPDEIISLNAKDLQGYEIEFDLKEPGVGLQTALQGALF